MFSKSPRSLNLKFSPALQCTALATVLLGGNPAAAESADVAGLRSLVETQARELASLRARLDAVENGVRGTQERVQIAEEQLDATAGVVERISTGAGDGAQWFANTRVSGYGEVHYNNLDADDSGRDLEQADFHRFVLFFGHRFSDRLSLFSELEVEHAVLEDSGDSAGEVALEQAYIEYRFDDEHVLRTGALLLPIGLVNETHEPPTFFGVERNDVENVIIPTTWSEGGISAAGSYANGFGWDFAVHTGLAMETAGSDAFRVREGRQHVSEATARDLAYTGRLRYRPIEGLDLAVSAQYQADASQADDDGLDEAWLVAMAANWRSGPFGLRAVWSQWNFEGDAVEAADVDEQTGWYVEPSWRFNVGTGETGVYVRYSDVDGARTRDRFEQWEIGMNYWPIEDVVFKADLRRREHDLNSEQGRDFDGIDLSVGYQF